MIKDRGLAISCKREGSQHVAVGVCMRKLETFRTCGCTAKVVACIEDPVVIEKILTHLDETAPATETIRLPESRVPPPVCLFD